MDESLAAFEQAYQQYLQAGQPRRAAMAVLWLGARFTERGELAVGAIGFGLSFRDPDNIALEFWAPRS